jgi:DNA-directed RNA polymerase specialized sigma24 family protein
LLALFEPDTNCPAWMLQILRHIWIDKLRHKKVAGTTVPLDETLVTEETHFGEVEWSPG